MKESSIASKQREVTKPFAQRDLNAQKDDRNHKIAKLKADLFKLNIKKTNCLIQNENIQLKPHSSTHTSIKLRGVDLLKIRAHLHSTRMKNKCTSDPIANQQHVNRMMRAVLFNWLLEITTKLQLKPRTILLCANIFDRYLAQKPIEKRTLQLLGITCLFIASKFEDIQPPKVKDLCFLCNNIYTSQQVVELEEDVLATLKFDLVFVSALDIAEVQLAMSSVDSEDANKLILFIFNTFMVQGTINLIDSFKLAGFACALVQRQNSQYAVNLDGIEIDINETFKLDQCFKQMMGVIKKHQLSALEKELKGLVGGVLEFEKEAN